MCGPALHGGATVNVILPDRVWSRLVSAAEARDTTVTDLLVAAIRPFVTPQTPHDRSRLRRARIIGLVQTGWPDRKISIRTGETRGFIADVRREAGLKPNKEKS